MLADHRASEICIGIVCAGIVLAGTDLGRARRRLATLFASLSAEIASRFSRTLATPAPNSRTPRRSGASSSVGSLRSTRSSTRRSANPPNCATTRRSCRRLWTVCSPPWPAGAWRRFCWRDCRERGPGKRRPPCCDKCRRHFARGLSRTSRHAGSPMPTACSRPAMQRYGGSSPCRREHRRCGCSPIRRLKRWPASRMPSTRWPLLVCRSGPAGSARAAAAGSAFPIGFHLWSVPGAHSS